MRNTLEKGLDAESYSLQTFEALLSRSMENLGRAFILCILNRMAKIVVVKNTANDIFLYLPHSLNPPQMSYLLSDYDIQGSL